MAPELFDFVVGRPVENVVHVDISNLVKTTVSLVKDSLRDGVPMVTLARTLAPLTLEYTRDDITSNFEVELSERQWRFARWHVDAWGPLRRRRRRCRARSGHG